MKIINLTETNPYLNLAIEEYLFLNSEEDVFILWQNSPTVVIGKNQNLYAEIDFDYIKKNNILVARRITGGGAVYHDLGNLNFSFISVNSADQTLDFSRFTTVIIDALNSFGIEASLSGRNDIVVDGKKISGNAQCASHGRVLHHGTLLYNTDFSVLSAVLKPDEKKIKSKAIKSVRSRVANISEFMQKSYSVEEFKNMLINFVAERLGSSPCGFEINDDVLAIAEKNRSNEWIFSDRDIVSKYSVNKSERFPFGSVEVHLLMKNELIEDAKINGDFFEISPISNLESWLCGKNIYSIKDKITDIYPSEYIFGITDREFWETFFN